MTKPQPTPILEKFKRLTYLMHKVNLMLREAVVLLDEIRGTPTDDGGDQ